MSNPFEAAIGYLLEGYKKAHGPSGPPKDPELKYALYEAVTFLKAAAKMDKERAWRELADSDIVYGLDGGLYDLLSALPNAPKGIK